MIRRRFMYLETIYLILLIILLESCGGTGVGNPMSSGPTGTVTIKSAPLAGPNAAFLEKRHSLFISWVDFFTYGFEHVFLGIQDALASVSNFSKFSVCNDTFIFIDGNGNQLNINGSTNPSVGRGLLTFSPTSTDAMTIGNLSIPANTTISEIDITFAVVPSVCSGANYAIEFDNGIGGGTIDITQNTAFKFKFTNGNFVTTGKSQIITLKFGDIVNAMVSEGSNLNDTTIQTINVGQGG